MRAFIRSRAASPAASSRARIQLRLRLPLLWLVLLLLAAFALPDRVWTTFLIGLGGLFVAAWFWAWQLSRGLHATRRLRYGWVSVGDRLEEEFTLANRSDVPALWVEIVDASNVPGYQANVVRSVSIHGTDKWRQSAVCTRRGQFHLGPWSIRSSDPFGIFTVTRTYAEQNDIIIHPPVHGRLPIPLPLGQSSGRARARLRSWQATINAASVRDYQPSDPYHWIHWPSTARRGELFVRQFDLDAAGDVWILLDMDTAVQLGEGRDGTEEHAVLLAASLAAQAERRQRAVGVVAYGQTPQVVTPGRGQGQQWRILRALALANADGTADLRAALRDLGRIVRRGAAALIITASGSSDWLSEVARLSKLGVQSTVILLDRRSFGGAENSAALRDAVQQLGCDVYLLRQGEVGQPLVEEERRGFWDFRVTGTGKVVVMRSPLEQAGRRERTR